MTNFVLKSKHVIFLCLITMLGGSQCSVKENDTTAYNDSFDVFCDSLGTVFTEAWAMEDTLKMEQTYMAYENYIANNPKLSETHDDMQLINMMVSMNIYMNNPERVGKILNKYMTEHNIAEDSLHTISLMYNFSMSQCARNSADSMLSAYYMQRITNKLPQFLSESEDSILTRVIGEEAEWEPNPRESDYQRGMGKLMMLLANMAI